MIRRARHRQLGETIRRRASEAPHPVANLSIARAATASSMIAGSAIAGPMAVGSAIAGLAMAGPMAVGSVTVGSAIAVSMTACSARQGASRTTCLRGTSSSAFGIDRSSRTRRFRVSNDDVWGTDVQGL